MGHVTRTSTVRMMLCLSGRRRRQSMIRCRGRQRRAGASCWRISLWERRRRGRDGRRVRTIRGERAERKPSWEGWGLVMEVIFLVIRGRVGEERGRLIVRACHHGCRSGRRVDRV